ncbi:unannotated protein [freshwater metagenome]|uniref:Unannotated protein n=1 Tax=freshwater metagenome TaxID=449393 RepID=A0A6J6Q5V0_9ZZZZ
MHQEVRLDAQLVAILHGHTDEFRDDIHGKAPCKIFDEVKGLTVVQVRQIPASDFSDSRFKLGYAPGCESA